MTPSFTTFQRYKNMPSLVFKGFFNAFLKNENKKITLGRLVWTA